MFLLVPISTPSKPQCQSPSSSLRALAIPNGSRSVGAYVVPGQMRIIGYWNLTRSVGHGVEVVRVLKRDGIGIRHILLGI